MSTTFSKALFALIIALSLGEAIVNAISINFISPLAECQRAELNLGGLPSPTLKTLSILIAPIGGKFSPLFFEETDPVAINPIGIGFQMIYPVNTSFVVVLSSNGSVLGTSDIFTVAPSPTTDTSCLNSTASFTANITLSLSLDRPQQCIAEQITYHTEVTPVPPLDMFAIVPGGVSKQIASKIPTGVNLSIVYVPDIEVGTKIFFMAMSTNGSGLGGSTELFTVGENILRSNTTDCVAGLKASESFKTSPW